MKKTLTAIALTSALLIGSSIAADQDGSMSSDMGKFDEMRMQMHNHQMEVHLKEMQSLMDRLHETKDLAERRQLLKKHRIQMAEMMSNMRSSREDMMMGMMGGGPKHGGEMPKGEKRRQHMIEKRLDMMDHMMEMMMRRDEIMMDH